MRLVVRVDSTGAERKVALLTSALRDLDPALRAFDRYLAARVRARFESGGPGWAPHAVETRRRRESRALQGLVRRLGREAWRTEERQARRLAEVEASGGDAERLRGRFARTLRRRLATVAELQAHVTGEARESLSASLAPRVARAHERAGNLLGRVANSFRSTVERGTLVRESAIPWAGAHNEGATVGHGARLPARPFLFIDEEDADTLVDILRDRLLVAAEGS